MSTPYGSDRRPGPEGEQEEPVRFTDRRRIDPLTGEVRTPADGGVFQGAAAPPGAPPAPEPEPELDDPRIADLEKQLEERTNDLQRVTAEYANYRRRVDRDREAQAAAAKSSVVLELLPILDDLDRARAHGDLTGSFGAVADKLTAAVAKLGLEPTGKVGDHFDPAVHEAVQFGTSPEVTEPTVTNVFRSGYSFAGKLLRPAVVVVTGPEHETAAPESGASA